MPSLANEITSYMDWYFETHNGEETSAKINNNFTKMFNFL